MARPDSIIIDHDLLRQLQEDQAYDYQRELIEEQSTLLDKWSHAPDSIPHEEPGASTMPSLDLSLPSISSWVWWTLLALLAAGIIYMMWRNGMLQQLVDAIASLRKRLAKDKETVEPDEMEEDEEEEDEDEAPVNDDTNIYSQDITPGDGDNIDNAMAAGKYRQAARLIYLTTLRALSDNGAVEWKRHKTPGDYASELDSPPFNQLTRLFVLVRYGNFEASRDLCLAMLRLKDEITGTKEEVAP